MCWHVLVKAKVLNIQKIIQEKSLLHLNEDEKIFEQRCYSRINPEKFLYNQAILL